MQNETIRNLWEIQPMDCDHIINLIWPRMEYGYLTDHFASKLRGYSANGETCDTKGVLRFYMDLDSENTNIFNRWIETPHKEYR